MFYSPQKPSTSRDVQITPKCDQNVQVNAQSSSEETSTSGNTTATDVPLALWVKGKRIPTEELPKFMMKMVWHIGVTIFHHSQKSVQESNYNLLIIYIKYIKITKIIHQNELTYTLQVFNLCKKKILNQFVT